MNCTSNAVDAAAPVAAGGAVQSVSAPAQPVVAPTAATAPPVAADATTAGGPQAVAGTEQLVPVLNQLSSTIGQLAATINAQQAVAAAPVAPTTPSVATTPAPVATTPAPVAPTTTTPVTGGGAPAPAPTGCPCCSGAMVGANAAPSNYTGGRRGKQGGSGGASGAKAGAHGTATSKDVKKWVTGDKDGLDKELLNRLATIGKKMGQKVSIDSGARTRAEQEKLYAAYLNGTGNLAAKPGTSNHESGNAADVSIGGVSLADNAKAKKLAGKLGLGFPVQGEAWHVEVM